MINLFEMFHGRAIFFVLIMLICAAFQSNEANKLIKRINEENSDDYRKPRFALAPFIEIVISIILLVICLFVPISPVVSE